MNYSNLSNDEKKKISNERQNAVRHAWKLECERVKLGQGTRTWSKVQQEELMTRGSVKGFEGHHMKSVSLYPEYAGDPRNIQFLTEEEHLYGAHQGNYHNLTNGYYDPYNKVMTEFEGEELPNVPEMDLSNEESELQTIINEDYGVESTNDELNNADTEISQGNENSNDESDGYEV